LELEGSIGNPSIPAIRRIRSISELISLAAMRLLPRLPPGVAASLLLPLITESFLKRNWCFSFLANVLLKVLFWKDNFSTRSEMLSPFLFHYFTLVLLFFLVLLN
jgi:hypothetical protein